MTWTFKRRDEIPSAEMRIRSSVCHLLQVLMQLIYLSAWFQPPIAKQIFEHFFLKLSRRLPACPISNRTEVPFSSSTLLTRYNSLRMQSNLTVGNPLSLDRIRSVLTRLEDTIIFSLIERAQFGHNPRIYQRGAFKELQEVGFTGSWLEWFLKETESFHGLSCFCPSLKHLT